MRCSPCRPLTVPSPTRPRPAVSGALTREWRYGWTPNTVTGAALGAAYLLTAILCAPPYWFACRWPSRDGRRRQLRRLQHRRKVAFRVDQKGVTLAAARFVPGAYEFLPLGGVHAVRPVAADGAPASRHCARPALRSALSWPALRSAGTAHVGVVRLGAAPYRASPPGAGDLGRATRGMQAFRVDHARLAAAIATFAPAVQLIKLA